MESFGQPSSEPCDEIDTDIEKELSRLSPARSLTQRLSPSAEAVNSATVRECNSALLTAATKHSLLSDRFHTVCSSLANVISVLVSGEDDILPTTLGIISSVRHYDDSLSQAWHSLLRVPSISCVVPQLSLEQRVGNTVLAGEDDRLFTRLALENKRLMYEAEEFRSKSFQTSRLENMMTQLLRFDYVVFRIYNLTGPSFIAERIISVCGQDSSMSLDGHWNGETVVLKFPRQIVFELKSRGVILGKSEPIDLINEELNEVTLLGDSIWSLHVETLLALTSSSVKQALDS